MDRKHLTAHSPDSARRYLSGEWQKKIVAIIVLAILGVSVWSQRISRAQGFLLDDSLHLQYSYEHNLEISPRDYLPGVPALRPLGRDAITLLLRLHGERDAPVIWTLLLVHVASSILIWLSLYRLTSDWWASLAGAAFFLLSCSAYLTIYWPAAIFDLLGTFFLACLLLSLSLITHPRGRYRPWLLLLTLPLLLAAVKAKESTIIVAAPMFLMWLMAAPARSAEGGRAPFRPRQLLRRLRDISLAEIIWIELTVWLVIFLSLSVYSNFGAKDPAEPYYSEYSPQVIGRSFGFYMSVLAFQTDDTGLIRPATALALLVVPCVLAFLLRSRWLFYGWVWFVLFLLPLAAFKNHYNYFFYPYPANIGTALMIAGLFGGGGEKLSRRWRHARAFRRTATLVFTAIVVWQSYAWLRFNSVPRWYDAYHRRNVQIMRALKVALPAPPRRSRIVLVIPEPTQFEQDATRVLKIVYHDFTLTGALFKERQQAENYLTYQTSDETLLPAWATLTLRNGYRELTLTGLQFTERQKAEAYLARPNLDDTFLAVWDGASFRLEDLSRF